MDYDLDVMGKSVTHYQDFVDDMLHADVGVEKYYTYVVTKLVKNVVPTLEQELSLLR